ncbi:MAG: sigma 54-interacting transcriptional regulator [Desulfovibrio sp.]|nr:sigma 54-interacting transcriptional regulator [Desulfovibrio sp.]
MIDLHGKNLVGLREPIFSPDGNLCGAIGKFQTLDNKGLIMDNIHSVREMNLELESIIESCSEGIYVTDHQGYGLRANRALYTIYGFKAEELIGVKIDVLVADGTVSDSACLQVLKTGRPATVIQVHKSGKQLLNTGRPIFDHEGNLVKAVVTVRDITSLNKLMDDLKQSNARNEKYYSELLRLRAAQTQYKDIVTASPGMQGIVDLAVRVVAGVDSGCLLLGESGAGKDVIARLIHTSGVRADKSFIKINCGAIPADLLESELFGYEQGAFTGAGKGGKAGMFELADGGTLFLDEIGEMPLTLQVKLLQVLQDMVLYRLGGTKPIRFDIRVIAATNRNLEEMVRLGKFREDLYYRINIVQMEIPPLRERAEDIVPLIKIFLEQINGKYKQKKSLSSDAVQCLLDYSWPGNVRELKNIIERAVVTSHGDLIGVVDLPAKIVNATAGSTYTGKKLKNIMEGVEKGIITDAIVQHRNLRKVGEALGIDPSTVFRKVKRYGISEDFTY